MATVNLPGSSGPSSSTSRRQSVPHDKNGHPSRPPQSQSNAGAAAGGSHQPLKRVSSDQQGLSKRGGGGAVDKAPSPTGGSVTSSRRASVQSITSEHSARSGIRASIPGLVESVRTWDPPQSFKSDFDFEICGRSLAGSPILTIKLGQWDFRKVSSSQKESWVRYMDYMYAKVDEKMRKNSKIVEHQVNQFVAVIDFHGISVRQMMSICGVSNMRLFVKRYETTYAGTMEAGYVVNASASYRMMINLLRPTMSARTLNSMSVFGSNQNEWKNALLGRIPEEQLPFTLGGQVVPAGTHSMDYKKLVYGRRYSIFAQAVKEQEGEGEDEDDDDEEVSDGDGEVVNLQSTSTNKAPGFGRTQSLEEEAETKL